MELDSWYPKIPFAGVVAGVSGSGKSVFVFSMLEKWDRMYPGDRIRKLIILYNTLQDLHLSIKDKYGDSCVLSKELRPEMLTNSYLGDPKEGTAVIVIDDANCGEYVNSKLVLELAIAKCHHYRIVLYILVQNMTCSRSSTWITIRRNCSQLFLFSLSRDQHYLKILNQELFGSIKSKTNLVRSAYLMSQQDSNLESNPYFYLWINSNVNIPFVRPVTKTIKYAVIYFQSDQMRRGLLDNESKIIYRVHDT